MNFKAVVLNLMFWMIITIILAFALDTIPIDVNVDYGLGTFTIDAGIIITISLILVTTFSLNGFDFNNLKKVNRKIIIDSLVLSFVINTVITLLFGLILIPLNKDSSAGFAVLAAMPCAVSVITGAAISRNNQEIAVAAVACSYVAGLILTPLISFITIGNAVNPFLVFIYILLFIVVPVVLALILNRFKINRDVRMIIVNLMLSITVFLSINKNKGPIMDEIYITIIILLIAIARIVILHLVSRQYVIWRKINTDSRTTFLTIGVWKTTGMAVAMCMTLLADYPMAVLPCIASIVVEDIWFPWAANKGAAIFDKHSKNEPT